MTDKELAVQRLLTWIRDKAAAAGAGNIVKWGDLKFEVASSAAPYGVYGLYPINSTFPNDVYESSAPIVLDGDTTADDDEVAMADTTGVEEGMVVEGAGIPIGATVTAVTTSTGIVISSPAGETATGVELVFYEAINGANVQETYTGELDRGTLIDIVVKQGKTILYSIFLVNQDQLERDVVDTNSQELSRIMTKKILYARIKDVLSYELAEPPAKFPGFIF